MLCVLWVHARHPRGHRYKPQLAHGAHLCARPRRSDQETSLLLSSAASEDTLFDFNPGADGIFGSTPHKVKTRPSYARHSRYFDSPPPVPDLHESVRLSSVVYTESDDDIAALAPPATADVSGRTSPVVQPLVPRTKTSELYREKSSIEQENVALQVDARSLRRLSLLQDRQQEHMSTRPLTLGKGTSMAQKEKGRQGGHEPPLKRALRPLRLMRSETAKRHMVHREREMLLDVVIRPRQRFAFQFSFVR